MTATLPQPTKTPVHDGASLYRGKIIQPDSLWYNSKNLHIRRNAPKLLHLMKITENDPLHAGLMADLKSVERLRRAFEVVAETYEQPFHTIYSQFYTAPDQDKGSVQNRILATLSELSAQHPEIPGILWCVLAHIGTREDVYEMRSLLGDDDYAFGCAKLNDAALHAMCMVTPLKTLIDQLMIASVSAIIVHACHCDSCMMKVSPAQGFTIEKPSDALLKIIYNAFIDQFFAEVIKSCGYDMPHAGLLDAAA